MSKERVTLSHVAQRAGVSAMTVSRALRSPDKVSPALLRRIEKIVAELGYVPNPAARALASGRTNVIGALIPSVTNNVFSDVLRGIYAATEDGPFEVQLGNTRYSPLTEEKLLAVFLSQKPAGLIVTGIDQSPASRRMLEGASCPIVQIMEIGSGPIDMMIGFSHYDGAAAATRHLIETGSRFPAFVGARMDPRTQRRFAGFRDVCSAAGCFSMSRCVTTPTPSTVTLGTRLFADLVARHPEVDGVFCNNDDLALGILFEAQRRCIAIPEKLTVCGFNDLEMMAAAEPSITSVRTPRFAIGRRAVEMIVARLADPGPDTGRGAAERVDTGFELVARQSTARRPR
ncbi:LacI family DNA-binding transcriptional regulator [Jiella sonneratiae]|uniref:LacI family DNA-binding transcriptional regulator n=1 Tax=Jiella sonneratiae TaxID=2816856 RepID=A0ABS3J4S4_9HYPH|nr:LacI family DNA-binding transcriptional regulator [Jiella sonneratiae]MBO0904671.1 LacI family DNA-binding transcriptional regulator [Jiella sonneratiae]